jgi:hypothetical protein
MSVSGTAVQNGPVERSPQAATGAGEGTRPFRGRRRYVINWRYQIRANLLSLFLALILLSLLNFSVHVVNQTNTEMVVQSHPELRAVLETKDRKQAWVMALGSLIFLGGVFALGIVQSHKTAGASFGLCRSLGKFQAGDYETRARLRRDDNLVELAVAFNDMADALQARTRAEIEALQAIMAELTKGHPPAADGDAIAALRRLIEEKERRLDSSSGS